MTTADDLLRQANTLAEKLRRARSTSRQQGGAPDAHELATMEARLTSLWTAIRQARAGGDASLAPGAEMRTRPKWDATASRPRRR